MNLYGFVFNSPIDLFDPVGLDEGVSWGDLRNSEECSDVYLEDDSKGKYNGLSNGIRSTAYCAMEATPPGMAWVAATGTGLDDKKVGGGGRAMAVGGLVGGAAVKAGAKSGAGFFCWLKKVLGFGDDAAKTTTRITGDALKAARKEFESLKPSLWRQEAATNPSRYSPS